MTQPFAPSLTNPRTKGAASPSLVSFKFKFRSVAAGDTLKDFTLRRRKVSPLPLGTYEYWNQGAGAWQAEEVYITATGTYRNGDEYSYTVATGWQTDWVYQWSVRTRNQLNEAGPYAIDSLVQIHQAPAMTTFVNSSTVSRPTFSWVLNAATGFYQDSYQMAVYTQAVTDAPGFDPSLPGWQAQAVWIMDQPSFSSTAYSVQMDTDVLPGETYTLFYNVTDSGGLSSGWVEGVTWSTLFNPPPPPDLILDDDQDAGVIRIISRGVFNMLDAETSVFNTTMGKWVETLNAQATPFPGYMAVRTSGMLFSAMDALHTTFAAQTTAYGTFEDERKTQSTPTGISRVATMGTGGTGQLMAVSAGTQYSALASARTGDSGLTVRLNFLWFKSDGTASTVNSRSSGPVVSLVAGAAAVSVTHLAAVCPADAVFAALEIEIAGTVDKTVIISEVAMSPSATIAWSPAGVGFDVRFIIEKTKDEGETWVPVWTASRDDPAHGGASATVDLVDRAAFLGVGNVQYRAQAIGQWSNNPVFSSYAYADAPTMLSAGWWLRHTTDPSRDVKFRPGDFKIDIDGDDEIVNSEGRLYPVLSVDTKAPVRTASVKATTIGVEEDIALDWLMTCGDALYLQTNSEGMGYHVRVSSRYSKELRASATLVVNSLVTAVWVYQFKLIFVEPYA